MVKMGLGQDKSSLKAKIVMYMVLITIVITSLISIVSILNSSNIIRSNAEKSFSLTANGKSDEIYSNFEKISYNSGLLAKLIAKNTGINSQASMQKLRSSKEIEYSKLRGITKFYADNTKGITGLYFYFDQRYAP